MNLPETGLVVMVSRGCPVCARAADIVSAICPGGVDHVLVSDDRELFAKYRVDRVPFLLVRRDGADVGWGPIETFGCSPRAVRAAVEEMLEDYEPGDLRRPEPRSGGGDCAQVRALLLAVTDLLTAAFAKAVTDGEAMAEAARRIRRVARRLRSGERPL